MARYGFIDPTASLRATVEEAVAPRKLPEELDQALNGLGGQIFGWLLNQLRRVRISCPDREAEDVFQQICLRVFLWIRRNGPDVAVGWFWTVAKNAYRNHSKRDLTGKRGPEQPLDPDLEDWLRNRMEGVPDAEAPDYSTDERIGRLQRRCIGRLPPRERQFILLDLVCRMSNEEIDAELRLQPKSRAALKAKAYRDLRAEILKELETGPFQRSPIRRAPS